MGACAGTAGNVRGDKRHAEQTVPNTKERRPWPGQGAKTGGRWDYTKQAVVNAVAAGLVEEITRDKTVVVFKKRRRKHSRRKNGFRRQVTFLRVLDVKMPGEVKGESMDHGEESQVAA